jgi:hypothetical protein
VLAAFGYSRKADRRQGFECGDILPTHVILLTIRRAQLDAFRQSLTDRLYLRLVRDLRRLCLARASALSDEELKAFCAREVPAARTRAIIAEDDLLRYLVFVLRYGPGFGEGEDSAWAGAILRRADLAPHEKLNLLDEYERFGQRNRTDG